MFYSNDQLKKLGFKKIGKNVQISNLCRFYKFKGNVGNNTRIDDYCIFKGNINIGKNVHISSFCYFAAVESKISIGDLTGISNKVSIYGVSDDFIGNYLTNPTVDKKFRNIIKGEVQIGKNVSIGAHVIILPKSKIGDSVSVGASSIVNRKLKSGYIYVSTNSLKKVIKKDVKLINKKLKNFKKN